MSDLAVEDIRPDCSNQGEQDSIEQVIIPRVTDIGDFEVKRALPTKSRKMVGPFIFWDQMGPGEFLSGKGLDVRPHPHIGLATLTYLFSGEIDHRDSLGFHQKIKPGDVNLMVAGSGIAHSERTDDAIRDEVNELFGIQSWLALPYDKEETVPSFSHLEKDSLPVIRDHGVQARVIVGELFGEVSPVKVPWETSYVSFELEQGKATEIPATIEERALYILRGKVSIGGRDHGSEQLLVLRPGDKITVNALEPSVFLLLGGSTMDGPRYIWWNFVSSKKERIEQAKQDWLDGKFAPVKEDTKEYIPLPEK